MELFLVLLSFSILFFAMEKILMKSVYLFENREKFSTKAKLKDIEYRDKSNTTVYYVEFTDNLGEVKEGKSLQYKGKPVFKIGDTLDIDYLIRDEMKNLIDTYLVDVKHENHKKMSESIEPKLKIFKYISIILFIASIIILIKDVIL